MSHVPELPEVEITARRLDAALRGAGIASAARAGHQRAEDVRSPARLARRSLDRRRAAARQAPRRRRHRGPVAAPAPDVGRAPAAVRQAGRPARPHLARARPPGRRARAAPARVRHPPGGLGEAAADATAVEEDPAIAGLGPEAWPDPPPLRELLAPQGARPLHAVLRDQHVITGIGRSWVDEILWTARLSPFQRAGDLDEAQATALREAIVGRLGDALDHYEEVVTLPIPDKLPLPLQVHRHAGEPCPVRDDHRGDPLRELRPLLLPEGPDGRTRAEGPPALAPAQVDARSAAKRRRPRRHGPPPRPPRMVGGPSEPAPKGPRHARARRRGTRLHPPRPGRRTRHALRPARAHGRPLLLPQGRHPGLHDAGVRRPRPPARLRGRGRRRARRLAGPGEEGQEVPREGGPELHAPRRRRPRGVRGVRDVGGEVDVRHGSTGARCARPS